MIQKLFFTANWYLVWAFFFLAILLYWKKYQKDFLWMFPAACIGGLTLIALSFLMTGNYASLLDGTLLNRLVMYVVPLAVFAGSQAMERENQ